MFIQTQPYKSQINQTFLSINDITPLNPNTQMITNFKDIKEIILPTRYIKRTVTFNYFMASRDYLLKASKEVFGNNDRQTSPNI